MASPVKEIVDKRRFALIDAWVTQPFIQMLVNDKEELKRLAYVRDGLFVEIAEPQQLGRRNPDRVVLIEGKSKPDINSSLWVAKDYDDHKGAYLKFLKRTYGIDATLKDLAGYNSDHLRNKARAPHDHSLIRIEMTPEVPNQRWGSLFEKMMSNPDFFQKEAAVMNYMICAKLGGEMPPEGRHDSATITRLTKYFEGIGLDGAKAKRGIENMLDRAYGTRLGDAPEAHHKSKKK